MFEDQNLIPYKDFTLKSEALDLKPYKRDWVGENPRPNPSTLA